MTLDDLGVLIRLIVGQEHANLSVADLDGDGQLGLGDVRTLIQIMVAL